MNKDIEDALLSIHTRLCQIGNELDALTTQYKFTGDEGEAIEFVHTNVVNAIREINQYIP